MAMYHTTLQLLTATSTMMKVYWYFFGIFSSIFFLIILGLLLFYGHDFCRWHRTHGFEIFSKEFHIVTLASVVRCLLLEEGQIQSVPFHQRLKAKRKKQKVLLPFKHSTPKGNHETKHSSNKIVIEWIINESEEVAF